MEEQNTKPSRNGKHAGISNGQKWILGISCLFLFLYIFFVIKCGIIDDNDRLSYMPYCSERGFRDGYGRLSFIPSMVFFLSPFIGAYYTILLYRGTYEKSKYNWIPLAIGVTCISIQSLLIFTAREKQEVLKVIISLVYISSAVFFYKWETVGNSKTRWIPFMVTIFALFFLNVFYLAFSRDTLSIFFNHQDSVPVEENNSINNSPFPQQYDYSEPQEESIQQDKDNQSNNKSFSDRYNYSEAQEKSIQRYKENQSNNRSFSNGYNYSEQESLDPSVDYE